jgi:two-component system alkaline phosphatase synthesis response regulator PhoP
MQRKKILIVDDEPDIRDILQIILEEEGYLTHTAAHLPALQDLLGFQPDLILLDILLAGSDGRAFCRQLKSQPSTAHIPVILMSAHGKARATRAESWGMISWRNRLR